MANSTQGNTTIQAYEDDANVLNLLWHLSPTRLEQVLAESSKRAEEHGITHEVAVRDTLDHMTTDAAFAETVHAYVVAALNNAKERDLFSYVGAGANQATGSDSAIDYTPPARTFQTGFSMGTNFEPPHTVVTPAAKLPFGFQPEASSTPAKKIGAIQPVAVSGTTTSEQETLPDGIYTEDRGKLLTIIAVLPEKLPGVMERYTENMERSGRTAKPAHAMSDAIYNALTVEDNNALTLAAKELALKRLSELPPSAVLRAAGAIASKDSSPAADSSVQHYLHSSSNTTGNTVMVSDAAISPRAGSSIPNIRAESRQESPWAERSKGNTTPSTGSSFSR